MLQGVFDIKYFPRDSRVMKTASLSERQALLTEGAEDGEGAPASPGYSGGLPPRPPSFGLATPNGRGATNGPIDGMGTPRESAR